MNISGGATGSTTGLGPVDEGSNPSPRASLLCDWTVAIHRKSLVAGVEGRITAYCPSEGM